MGNQEAGQDSVQTAPNQTPPPQIDLVASLAGNRVVITGCGSFRLPHGSGQHRFNFRLTDTTGLNVKFKEIEDGMLDAADDCEACPPPSGMNSSQIFNVIRQGDTKAAFSDRNDDRPAPMAISYQLNFDCDDRTKLPIAYDPIIINGTR